MAPGPLGFALVQHPGSNAGSRIANSPHSGIAGAFYAQEISKVGAYGDGGMGHMCCPGHQDSQELFLAALAGQAAAAQHVLALQPGIATGIPPWSIGVNYPVLQGWPPAAEAYESMAGGWANCPMGTHAWAELILDVWLRVLPVPGSIEGIKSMAVTLYRRILARAASSTPGKDEAVLQWPGGGISDKVLLAVCMWLAIKMDGPHTKELLSCSYLARALWVHAEDMLAGEVAVLNFLDWNLFASLPNVAVTGAEAGAAAAAAAAEGMAAGPEGEGDWDTDLSIPETPRGASEGDGEEHLHVQIDHLRIDLALIPQWGDDADDSEEAEEAAWTELVPPTHHSAWERAGAEGVDTADFAEACAQRASEAELEWDGRRPSMKLRRMTQESDVSQAGFAYVAERLEAVRE